MGEKQWGSRIGFLLATAGAAIGLGNLWKFPYLMGENGGFTFLVVYLIFVLILGLPCMMLEMSLGRYTGRDPIQSYKMVNPKAKIVGIFGVLAPFIILSYYSVIGGWLIKYVVSYATTFNAPADFGTFIASPTTVIWHFIFMAMVIYVCYKGIGGIEKASKIMLPALFVLLIIIIFRSVSLKGSMEGIKFIFSPKKGFSLARVNAALGQVFYSLSLCMGITITYGSYLSKKENIPKSCAVVAGMDTLLAILAGIAIFPAVFVFGLEPGQGPGLVFVTLPKVFGAMSGGSIFAIAFFILMFFAALTSAIALLEVVVSFAIDSWGWSRNKSVAVMGIAVAILGIPSALSSGLLADVTILNYSVFDFIGMISDNILLPIGGILMCYFIGWKFDITKLTDEMEQGCPNFKIKKLWIASIKYVAPILLIIVTVSGFVGVYHSITGM